MKKKTIYQIAMENNVSKYKVRSVIIEDLGWSMDRFERRGQRLILINTDEEKKIVEKLRPFVEKKTIPIAKMRPIIQSIEGIQEQLKIIKMQLAGLLDNKDD